MKIVSYKEFYDFFDNIIVFFMAVTAFIIFLGVFKDFIYLILWKLNCYFFVLNKVFYFLSFFSKKFKPFSKREMKAAYILKKKFPNMVDLIFINNSDSFYKIYKDFIYKKKNKKKQKKN